jgi:hypothetical protein
MNGDPAINDLTRKAKRSRRLPPDAACGTCGGTEQLIPKADGVILCYEHRGPAVRYELDHLAGRANLPGLTALLLPNAHREVTELRTNLGKDDWPRANGDPLLVVGHALAGFASLLWVIAKWLIDLGLWLHGTLGTNWWERAPQSPFAP